MRTILLLLLYIAPAVTAAAAAAWLGRRIPGRLLATFLLLPAAFLFSGFFLGRTILPVDHVRLIEPWNASARGARPYNPNLNDAVTQFAPWAEAVRLAWSEGSLPLRNRWNGCGTALAANGLSAAFAPWTFFLFLLPVTSSFDLLVGWKLFFALTGAWLWLKELGSRDLTAAFGAIAFGLSLTMTPWLLFPQTSAMALFVWILFAIERLRDPASSPRAFIALVVLLAVWPLSGHLESVASFSLFGAAWLGLRVMSGDFPRDARSWRALASSSLLALGLSAFALLPQALAILASNRLVLAREPFWSRIFSWSPHGPVWPGLWVTLFPRSLGDSIGTSMLKESPGSFAEIGLASIGTIGAGCALLFLRPGSPRRRSSRVLLALLAFGLFAGIGLWPFAEIVGMLPALRLMFPLRWLSWAAVAGAALAALELDRLVGDLKQSRRAAAALPVSFAVIAGLAVVWFARHRTEYASLGALDQQTRSLVVVLLVLGAGMVAAAAAGVAGSGRRALPLMLTGILAAELFWQGRRLYRFGAPGDLFPETPLVSFLRSRPRPFRVLGEGKVLFPGSNVFAGVEDVRTHDPVERADYVRFLDACCGYEPAAYFKKIRDINDPALALLNVRYLVSTAGRSVPGPRWRPVYSGPDGTVFENPRSRPRVFPADSAETLAISSYRERTNRAEVAFRSAPSRPLLLRTSLVDDGGWTVRDGSGRLLDKSAAYAPFLGFVLPAGESRATLSYAPPGFFAGSALSITALTAILLWAISRRSRRRRSRDAAPGDELDSRSP